jgi:hypothetical protein
MTLSNIVYLPIEGDVPYPELRWAPKTVGDSLQRILDCTTYMEWINDTVASITLVISPANEGDLTYTVTQAPGPTQPVAIWQFSAGNIYTDYAVQVTITTTGGQVIQRYIFQLVEPLSVNRATNPPTAILEGPPGPPAEGLPAFNTYVMDNLDKSPNVALSNGGLTVTGAALGGVRADLPIVDTNVYFEATVITLGTSFSIGIGDYLATLASTIGADGHAVGYSSTAGKFLFNSVAFGTPFAAPAVGSVFGFAISPLFHNMWVALNGGAWDNTAGDNPVTNVGGLNGTGLLNGLLGFLFKANGLYVMVAPNTGASLLLNFGASEFVYAPPAGY